MTSHTMQLEYARILRLHECAVNPDRTRPVHTKLEPMNRTGRHISAKVRLERTARTPMTINEPLEL